VAGVAAATTGGGAGTWGVAPGASLIDVRVMGAAGKGDTADISDGVLWAAGGAVPGVPTLTSPATVINMSVGARTACPATVQAAIDFALARGIPVVGAAGNDGQDASNHWPGNCQGVITVAASTRHGGREPTSNFGPRVNVVAPGGDVVSTSNRGKKKPEGAAFAIRSGTSAAAPHVAGTIALLQSANASYGPGALATVLACTASQAVADCPGCGKRIDAKAAMDYVSTYGCTTVGPVQICGGPCFPWEPGKLDPKTPIAAPIDPTR
jgi:serine protease